MDDRKVWLNGRMIPWEKATVHIMSHGLSRGSAIFEVFGVHDVGRVPAAFRMTDHLKRLFGSAGMLGMELAQSHDELIEAVKETVRVNSLRSGFIKIVAYYGEESLANLVPEAKLDLSIFALPSGADTYIASSKGVSACLCQWRKLHPLTVPVGAKAAAHYLNGMLARQEAKRRGFDIGLMLDTHGFVAEGSIESVFAVKDGAIRTPPLGRVLASISRDSVLQAAPAFGVEARESALRPEDLSMADEMFFSATPYKALPVNRLEEKNFGKVPGPVSRKIIEGFETIMTGGDDRFAHWIEPLT